MNIGLHYTLDDVNSIADPEILAIAKRITPNDAKEFGAIWELFGERAMPIQTDEFEILKRQYTKPNITVTASGSGADWDSTNDITALPVTSGDAAILTVGDILLVDDEIVVVKSVNRTANTIDLYERGSGETDAAAHGTSAVSVLIIGNANIEGAVDVEAMVEETDVYTNYCQIVLEKIDLTKADSDQARRTGQTVATYEDEAMIRVKRDLARSAIYGTARAGTKTIPASTRGLIGWLNLSDGLKTAVGGAFTQTVLDNMLNQIRMEGGSPNAIVMSVANKKAFNAFTSADSVVQDVKDRTTGRIVEAYIADGLGQIPVIVDLDMPNDVVAIVDTTKLTKGWKVGDELRMVDEPPVNSRQMAKTIQGKFGLAVENIGQSHGLLTGLTTT